MKIEIDYWVDDVANPIDGELPLPLPIEEQSHAIDSNEMCAPNTDLHTRLTMDPVDQFIEVNDTFPTICSECGFSERQYVNTRRHKRMKLMHNICIKKGLICPTCGFHFAQTVVTRQQKLNKVRHNLCP